MNKITKIAQLAINHDYYCSDSNYYSNDPYEKFETFADYFEEFKDSDVDMNLVFRFDIAKNEKDDERDDVEKWDFYMHIFRIAQRKWIFACSFIKKVTDEDVENILKYLEPHKEKLESIWKPL